MLSLHQLTCFLSVYEHGSLTRAAEELGYAQPSVSEQIRALEKSLGVQLFRRVGRGVVPTTVADTLRPHAERTLAAAEETRRAAQAVKSFETGTIRFGMFGTARLYAGAGLVADVLDRYPGVRVELIGQNSSEVAEELRRGRLEAAMIAIHSVESEGMQVIPVARDEIVYISNDPAQLEHPVTAKRLSEATPGDARDHVAGHRLDPDHAAPAAARDRPQPAHADRGRGRRDRGRAGRPRPRGLGHPARGRRAAAAPAGAEGRLGQLPAQALRQLRHRAPPGRDPLPRRPADDRARHQADPGHRAAA